VATARPSISKPRARGFDRLGELVGATGRVLVHPHEDPLVIAGQGTVGLEIIEDLPDVDIILVPVGGGALVAGIATAAENCRIVGVEPEGSPAFHEALAAGVPVRARVESIADALLVPSAGEHPVEICTRLGVESVLVSEEEIRTGFRFLYERAKLAAEPGAAVGVAALLAGKIGEVEGKTVAVVVSGGNVSPETASAILKEIPASSDET
jgi:threonine dehydratase